MTELELESPSLVGLIRRSFGEKSVPVLAHAYHLASTGGGKLEEVALQRTEGASFNPRPARIAHILLIEHPQTTLEMTAAALLCSMPLFALNEMRPESQFLIDCQMIALRAHQLISEEISYEENPCPESLSIALACLLDQVRHLHMEPKDRINTEKRLRNAIQLSLLATNQQSSHRLVTLLQSAVERFNRYKNTN